MVFADLCDEEHRPFKVLLGDRKGVKWAANFEPNDGGVTLRGGSVEGSGTSAEDPSVVEATVRLDLQRFSISL